MITASHLVVWQPCHAVADADAVLHLSRGKLGRPAFCDVLELVSIWKRVKDEKSTFHLQWNAHDAGPVATVRITRAIVEALR